MYLCDLYKFWEKSKDFIRAKIDILGTIGTIQSEDYTNNWSKYGFIALFLITQVVICHKSSESSEGIWRLYVGFSDLECIFQSVTYDWETWIRSINEAP